MFYNIFRLILYIFSFIFFIFKPKKIKFVFDRFFQDLSILKKGEDYTWIHCSSVGEVNLLDGFIKKLKIKSSENILLSVFTETGYQTATKKYNDDDQITIIKFPLDDLFILKKIFNKIHVKKLILVETEIWPNLINLASKKAKIYLINGRISNRSFKRYIKIKSLLKSLFKKIDIFFMQTEDDKEKILSLGAEIEKVKVFGNLKFDISFEKYSDEEKLLLRNQINPKNKKIFVAGSTRDGEEEILLKVFIKLLFESEDTLLVIVPRHLERIKSIETLIKKLDFSYKKFSELGKSNIGDDYEILIVDEMGILRKFYSIADVVFVGGTLVDIGGHSLLEPLFYEKTPMFGGYLQNVKEISKEILRLNIGVMVVNEEEILEAIRYLKTDKIDKNNIKIFFENNKNVSEKIIAFMEE